MNVKVPGGERGESRREHKARKACILRFFLPMG
jgi:hypothetical protein